jgi:septum formation protein
LDDIQETLIQKYAASGSPMDKAGAYGIQDEGALLIRCVEGDYYAVVGLPISGLARELSLLGLVPILCRKEGTQLCPD